MDDLDIYTWLYEHYAVPQLRAISDKHEDIAAQFANCLGLSDKNRWRLQEIVAEMRQHWGVEVFALGVKFGRDLAAPHVPDEDCGGLLYFLPKLDQPVP